MRCPPRSPKPRRGRRRRAHDTPHPVQAIPPAPSLPLRPLRDHALASAANAGRPPTGPARAFRAQARQGLTLYTQGGELTAYGNLDVSIDGMTKGISSLRAPDGSRPVGDLGWQPDISTNMSYIGVAASRPFRSGLQLVYQLETQIDISATSGTGENNSARATWSRAASLAQQLRRTGVDDLGAVLIGKTDAPYKQSTARLNPFIA